MIEKVEALRNNKFKQMELPCWRPKQSFCQTAYIFLAFGGLFSILGAVLLTKSNQILQFTFRYDTTCGPVYLPDQSVPPTDPLPDDYCNLKIQITEAIPAPVYISYDMTNFYQNHRRYIKSRSYKQLLGSEITADEASTMCEPSVTNEQMNRVWAFDN